MIGGQAAARQRDGHAVEIEEAQDELLAVQRGHRGRADVERTTAPDEVDAAVLREAMLGDVEVRHDLDARQHRGPLTDRDGRGVLQEPVDTEAHQQAVGGRLEVDVAGASCDGPVDQVVHEVGRTEPWS